MHPLEGAARLARQWRMQNILVMRRGSKQMCCHPLPRSNPLTDRVESLLFIEESCPVLVSARMWARVLTGWTLRPSQEFLDICVRDLGPCPNMGRVRPDIQTVGVGDWELGATRHWVRKSLRLHVGGKGYDLHSKSRRSG